VKVNSLLKKHLAGRYKLIRCVVHDDVLRWRTSAVDILRSTYDLIQILKTDNFPIILVNRFTKLDNSDE